MVLDLSYKYLNVDRRFITKNFYTLIVLENELLTNDSYSVGTLRSNKENVLKLPKLNCYIAK